MFQFDLAVFFDMLSAPLDFLLGLNLEVSSSSGCLGWATLFYCETP